VGIDWHTFVVIVHRKGRGERREMRIPPPVPLAEGDKGGGKNPHNFFVYSLITSAISAFSAVSRTVTFCREVCK